MKKGALYAQVKIIRLNIAQAIDAFLINNMKSGAHESIKVEVQKECLIQLLTLVVLQKVEVNQEMMEEFIHMLVKINIDNYGWNNNKWRGKDIKRGAKVQIVEVEVVVQKPSKV